MTNKTNINPTSNEQHCAHKAGKSDHKDLIPRSKANPVKINVTNMTKVIIIET